MAKSKLVVAVDCDDTLVPAASRIMDEYYNLYSVRVPVDDFYARDSEIWGVGDYSEAIKRVDDILFRPGFMGSIQPFDDAKEVIERLRQKGVEWHIVTGRSDKIEQITIDMANQYFPGLFKSIEHTNYFDSNRIRSKGEVCQQINADVLIDDHVDHLENALSGFGLKHAIIYGDYGWNRNAQVLNTKRCRNWLEVEDEINNLLG